MNVSFDYHRINRTLLPKLTSELQQVLLSDSDSVLRKYTLGVHKQLASYMGVKHSYLVDSGTAALQLAFFLAGVREGDEVIVPCVNYPSAILSILYLGAKPDFIDVKENATINESLIEENITERTKAIMPVHLFGHACSMSAITNLAKKYNLKVVEDACQAHGSTLNGAKLGSLGDINALSFTYHKTIGTIGGGGAVLFNNPSFVSDLDGALIIEKDHEFLIKSRRAPGKMSTADQALLSVKLRIASFLEKDKKKNQHLYFKGLQGIDQVTIFPDQEGEQSVRQSFFILAEERDVLLRYLKNHRIIAKEPYTASNQMKQFKKYIKGDFPQANMYTKMGLLLPLYSLMKEPEINAVCYAIKQFYS